MTTVREASFDLFRAHGMTTMFGNPGSTELPMLADFPDDFTLRARAPGGGRRRDGRRLRAGERRSGARQPPHRARGRQRDGRDLQRAGEPLAAGDHRRPAGALADDDAGEPDQPRRDPDAAPAGQVELRAAAGRGRPARARPRDPPRRRCRRRGPTFVSIPMDDWDAEVDDDDAARGDRAPDRPAAPSATPRRSPTSPAGSRPPSNPVLVAGPDIDASGAWDAAVALAERQHLPVFAIPAPGGGRLGFPEGHPNFRGVLPPAIGPVSETLAGQRPDPRRRLLGLPLLPQHPRAAAARGRGAGRDHLRPRRGGAGADGRRDRRRRQAHARARCSPRSASPSATRASRCPSRPRARSEDPITGHRGDARARAPPSPTTGSSSSRRRRRRSRCATSCGSRGPAATTSAPAAGSASASPPRSASSSPSPTGRSSASSARARSSTRSPPSGARSPTTCRSRSSSCATASTRSSSGSRRSRASRARPGSTCRRSTRAAIAAGYGVNAERGRRADELREALADRDRARARPELVEVGVAPGMWLF